MDGWIKLHRKLLKKGYYTDSHYVHLWIHLIMKANYQDTEFLFNNQIMIIKRGQFITGRHELSRETGIDSSKIERILKSLKTGQQIEQQTFNKFRVITICNYEDYQLVEQQNEQHVNNKRTTNEQQMNTTKKDKNIKKEKNTDIESFISNWNSLFVSDYKVTGGRTAKLKTRLEAFSLDQILQATRNLSASKFHQGDNERHWKADPDFLLRSDEQIDKWLNATTAQKAKHYVHLDEEALKILDSK